MDERGLLEVRAQGLPYSKLLHTLVQLSPLHPLLCAHITPCLTHYRALLRGSWIMNISLNPERPYH